MKENQMNQTGREEIYQRINKIFEDIFDDDSIKVSDSTTASDIEGWDSLTHITLISAIEDEFGIRFGMKAVQKLQNVGDMVNLIAGLAGK